ncbi:SMP-30/gluconolactonase/LRE family protein [Myxococcus sp. SDU36]|uniref:SMP-30/gluconolactonase/LRE family protein n=1 Tax=Myxococcus sp. SDU36 TaxID=2831967 RepID=UPI0025430CE7|nr:SMP-30/gluconolactonase/LRE family protein [Myxococcus sp. SDU36]WIG95955.1 SMP-30/gluconolactonase/LRE family protein [Myxococcus sp. SDU36]
MKTFNLLGRIAVTTWIAVGCNSEEPDVVEDDAPSLTQCHPFAARDTSPVRSQRAEGVPTEVTAWTTPIAPAYEGPLAVNSDLEGAERFGATELRGAEDIAFDAQGRLYTGTADGTVWRGTVDAEGRPTSFTALATLTDARPLGLAFDACGNLLVAASKRGLVGISPDGIVRTLADRVDGTRIEYADELAVAADGTVYLSDASTRYASAWPYDFLEGKPNGRVIAYEPATGAVRTVVDDIYFANGVAVTADESAILIAETFRGRVLRHWLSGARAGTTEPFIENLPVTPDNITLDAQSQLWTTGYLRTDELDALSGSAQQRLALLQNFTYEQLVAGFPVAPHVLVTVHDAQGTLVRSFHDATGGLFSLSTAVPHASWLYLGTLSGQGIARVPVP